MSDLLSINASPREQQQLQEDEEAHFQVSRSSKAGQFDQIWWLHLENQFRHKSVLLCSSRKLWKCWALQRANNLKKCFVTCPSDFFFFEIFSRRRHVILIFWVCHVKSVNSTQFIFSFSPVYLMTFSIPLSFSISISVAVFYLILSFTQSNFLPQFLTIKHTLTFSVVLPVSTLYLSLSQTNTIPFSLSYYRLSPIFILSRKYFRIITPTRTTMSLCPSPLSLTGTSLTSLIFCLLLSLVTFQSVPLFI